MLLTKEMAEAVAAYLTHQRDGAKIGDFAVIYRVNEVDLIDAIKQVGDGWHLIAEDAVIEWLLTCPAFKDHWV